MLCIYHINLPLFILFCFLCKFKFYNKHFLHMVPHLFPLSFQEKCGGKPCFMISNHPSLGGKGAPEILYVLFLSLVLDH